MKQKEKELNWLEQEAWIDKDLDWDLRKSHLANMGQETRCITQLIRLVRTATQQHKPKEKEK